MLCALNICQDIGNDHLLTNSGYDNHSCINFLFHGAINQVDSSTDLLDKVDLTKVVKRPTKKPTSVGPHKLVLNKKQRLENKNFRSLSGSLYGVSVDSSSDEDNIP